MPHPALNEETGGGPYISLARLPYVLSQVMNPIGIVQLWAQNWIDITTAAGTPLTLFADGASTLPGINLADSEALNVRWNNHATPGSIMQQCAIIDPDPDFDWTINYLLSKTGATVGDAVTMESSLFFIQGTELHDSDTAVVDLSAAIVGNATAKTVSHVQATIAAADIPDRKSPSAPMLINVKVKPTAGTLGTDDLFMHACWLQYRRLPQNRVWEG